MEDLLAPVSLCGELIGADRFAIDTEAIDLWLAPLCAPAAGDLALLDAEEGARAARASERSHFAAGRAVLRRILARYVGGNPRALAFEVGEHGRPALRDGGPDFNLSHSGDRVLVAVACAGRVGVDIQRVEAQRDLHGLARRFFAPEEVASLDALGGEDFASAFFRIWCCKEAYLKALGASLSVLPSRTFACEVSSSGRARIVRAGQVASDASGSPVGWKLLLPEPPEGYAAALAWDAPAARVRAFWLGPAPG